MCSLCERSLPALAHLDLEHFHCLVSRLASLEGQPRGIAGLCPHEGLGATGLRVACETERPQGLELPRAVRLEHGFRHGARGDREWSRTICTFPFIGSPAEFAARGSRTFTAARRFTAARSSGGVASTRSSDCTCKAGHECGDLINYKKNHLINYKKNHGINYKKNLARATPSSHAWSSLRRLLPPSG